MTQHVVHLLPPQVVIEVMSGRGKKETGQNAIQSARGIPPPGCPAHRHKCASQLFAELEEGLPCLSAMMNFSVIVYTASRFDQPPRKVPLPFLVESPATDRLSGASTVPAPSQRRSPFKRRPRDAEALQVHQICMIKTMFKAQMQA
jgi:hypothetical protein